VLCCAVLCCPVMRYSMHLYTVTVQELLNAILLHLHFIQLSWICCVGRPVAYPCCCEDGAYLMAPRMVSLPRSLRVRLSVGSPSFLMSHQSTLPSVDTDMHSVPVFDCSQAKSYTGSLQGTQIITHLLVMQQACRSAVGAVTLSHRQCACSKPC